MESGDEAEPYSTETELPSPLAMDMHPAAAEAEHVSSILIPQVGSLASQTRSKREGGDLAGETICGWPKCRSLCLV